MKRIMCVLINFSLLGLQGVLLAKDSYESVKKQEIQKAIEQEKKFAKEQRFYKADEYDFKSAEVNEKSLKNLPILPLDELDMDDVYD